MPEYYIVCKRHGYRKDYAINFWGPNNSGYSYNLNYAGIYSEEDIKKFPMSHYCDDMPVLKSVVDSFAIDAVVGNRELGKACPNTPETRKELGVKLTELHTGPTSWDSRAFVNPKLFLNRNKNTIDIIKQIESKQCQN